MSRLIRATDEEKRDRDRLAWQAWGAKLTEDQFLRRERLLRSHPWAASGMDTWLWRDDDGAVLSSCETFVGRSFFEGALSRSYAVASVFTEEARRGQRHASRMMDALVAQIRRDDPAAHAITLYSDVGEAIYARSGFVALPARDRVFASCEGDPAQGVDEVIAEEALKVPPPPATEPFLLWPDAPQMDWHRARERFYAETLKRPRNGICGARVGESFAFWVADYKNEQLLILLLTEPTRAAIELLLIAARRTAYQLGLPRVVLWEDEGLTPALAGLSGESVPREGSLPMIVALHPRLRPEQWRLRPRALWV